MKSNSFLFAVLGVFVAGFFFGCGPSEEYLRSQEQLASNRAAARAVYERVQASPGQTLAEMEKAARELQDARKLDPENPAVASLANSLEGKIAALKDQLKTLYAQSEADIKKEDWPAAADKLRRINKLQPNYEDTANRLAKVEQEGAKLLYQQGRTLGKQDDWKLAAQTYKKLMEINPNYYDVAKLYQEAHSRDTVDYYLTEGDNAVRSSNWDRAIMLFEKATEYQPENMELRQKLDSTKAKVGQIYFTEVVKLTNQNQLYKALTQLDAARNYSPTLQDDPSYREFVGKLCTKLIERADSYGEKENWGNAYVWLQKAELFSPNYPNLFKKILLAKDKINSRIKKSIAVFDFESPSNNKDAGKIAANELIAYLSRNASGDLRIMERENLQSILKEMQLGQTGLVDLKTAQSMVKMRGIDNSIMGSVLRYFTDKVDIKSDGQAKVLVSNDEVPNQDYSIWLATHPKYTQEELAGAPPKTVKKPDYRIVTYKKGVVKITAMIDIAYKLVDNGTSENIFTKTIAGKSIKDGKYQDEVAMAEIPIPGIPLEIPSEMEVLDELTKQKLAEVGQSVLAQYQNLETKYYNDALDQEKRRDFIEAVERYTDAIFDEKLKNKPTSISQKAQTSIEKLIQGI